MPEKRDLAVKVDDFLQKISAAILRQKNKYAEETGVSRQQLDVLEIIFVKGRLTMGELCKEISSACSTATDLADKLEKAGYLERVREKKDRRVVRLNILPKGEELVRGVREKRLEELERLLGDCGLPGELETVSFWEKIAAKIK